MIDLMVIRVVVYNKIPVISFENDIVEKRKLGDCKVDQILNKIEDQVGKDFEKTEKVKIKKTVREICIDR